MNDEDEVIAVGHILQSMEAESSLHRRWHGSVLGHIVIDRDHAGGHARIIANYFAENPVYMDFQFRR
jgi:hypothetical protein